MKPTYTPLGLKTTKHPHSSRLLMFASDVMWVSRSDLMRILSLKHDGVTNIYTFVKDGKRKVLVSLPLAHGGMVSSKSVAQ